MPFSFPSSPAVGAVSSQNGRTYVWDGYVWQLQSTVAGHGSSHAAAGSDPVTLTTSQISDLAAGSNAAARIFLWQTFR